MKEEFLQFIWNHQLIDTDKLYTPQGEKIEIIQKGMLSPDAGPDFINARVKIGQTLWAGNVEIHIHASDWLKHNHQTDNKYNNVVLHVVKHYDTDIKRPDGSTIHTLVLEHGGVYQANYERLQNSRKWVACENQLPLLDAFSVHHWLDSLTAERLQQKVSWVQHQQTDTLNNWQQIMFVSLTRSLGNNTNALPFEILARQLPVTLLQKEGDKRLAIEALLFGMAGFLKEEPTDRYQAQLKKEFAFQQQKHHLKTLDPAMWHFLRMRPAAFPTIRLAQLAGLLATRPNLFSEILQCHQINELILLLKHEVSGYWKSHYMFGKASKKSNKTIGKAQIQVMVINAIVPVLFAYGRSIGNETLTEKALNWLTELPAEKNSIINRWEERGIKPLNAAHSQALLQLKKVYCNNKRCMHCSIGAKIIMEA